MVKRNLVVPILFGSLLVAMVTTGCMSNKIIASDVTVPEADTAVVYFYSHDNYNPGAGAVYRHPIAPKTLDGRSLPQGLSVGTGYYGLRVPAGEHTFTADAKWFSGLTVLVVDRMGGLKGAKYFTAKDVQFTYNFKAGVSYYLEPVLTGGEGAEVGWLLDEASRISGEPFIGLIAIHAVVEYDKYLFPITSDDTRIGVIRFDQEVSF